MLRSLIWKIKSGNMMSYREITDEDSFISYEILNDGEHLQLEQKHEDEDYMEPEQVILMTRNVAVQLAKIILQEMA